MTDRLLDFADSAAVLSTQNELLVIKIEDQPPQTVPLSDIAAIVASNPQIVFTQNLVAALGRAGAILICCDQRRRPVSMLLPLEAHFAQTERFLAQAAAPAPLKKRIWQDLVQTKIRAQGQVLRLQHGQDAGLPQLALKVRSGDPANVEATAAQRYWPRLFDNHAFHRGDENDPRNSMLNYGYAVLRGITARAVCASGLHPSLGVNHRNRYNAFCLADDLMEPLRPLVDRRVAFLCRETPPEEWQLSRAVKAALLAGMAERYGVGGERRTLFDIVARLSQALASAFLLKQRSFRCEEIEIE